MTIQPVSLKYLRFFVVIPLKVRYKSKYTTTLFLGAGVNASVGTIRALVPLYTIPPPLPIHRGDEQGRFSTHERRRDGIVYVGYESTRVKGEYRSSGKIIKRFSSPGSLIDMYV